MELDVYKKLHEISTQHQARQQQQQKNPAVTSADDVLTNARRAALDKKSGGGLQRTSTFVSARHDYETSASWLKDDGLAEEIETEVEALLAKVKTIAQAPVAVAGVPTSSHHHDHAVAKLLEDDDAAVRGQRALMDRLARSVTLTRGGPQAQAQGADAGPSGRSSSNGGHVNGSGAAASKLQRSMSMIPEGQGSEAAGGPDRAPGSPSKPGASGGLGRSPTLLRRAHTEGPSTLGRQAAEEGARQSNSQLAQDSGLSEYGQQQAGGFEDGLPGALGMRTAGPGPGLARQGTLMRTPPHQGSDSSSSVAAQGGGPGSLPSIGSPSGAGTGPSSAAFGELGSPGGAGGAQRSAGLARSPTLQRAPTLARSPTLMRQQQGQAAQQLQQQQGQAQPQPGGPYMMSTTTITPHTISRSTELPTLSQLPAALTAAVAAQSPRAPSYVPARSASSFTFLPSSHSSSNSPADQLYGSLLKANASSPGAAPGSGSYPLSAEAQTVLSSGSIVSSGAEPFALLKDPLVSIPLGRAGAAGAGAGAAAAASAGGAGAGSGSPTGAGAGAGAGVAAGAAAVAGLQRMQSKRDMAAHSAIGLHLLSQQPLADVRLPSRLGQSSIGAPAGADGGGLGAASLPLGRAAVAQMRAFEMMSNLKASIGGGLGNGPGSGDNDGSSNSPGGMSGGRLGAVHFSPNLSVSAPLPTVDTAGSAPEGGADQGLEGGAPLPSLFRLQAHPVSRRAGTVAAGAAWGSQGGPRVGLGATASTLGSRGSSSSISSIGRSSSTSLNTLPGPMPGVVSSNTGSVGVAGPAAAAASAFTGLSPVPPTVQMPAAQALLQKQRRQGLQAGPVLSSRLAASLEMVMGRQQTGSS